MSLPGHFQLADDGLVGVALRVVEIDVARLGILDEDEAVLALVRHHALHPEAFDQAGQVLCAGRVFGLVECNNGD